MTTSPEEFYLKTVRSRHKDATAALHQFIRVAINSSDDKHRAQAATLARSTLIALRDIVDDSFHPDWLTPTIANIDGFLSGPSTEGATTAAIRIATHYYPTISGYKWTFDAPATRGIDFDKLFETSRDDNDIPRLFDSLIDCLQQIIDSGQIDSLKILRELESMTATLKRARKGSYIATRSAWQFVASWMRNTGWEALGEIPGLGAVVRGLPATMADTDRAMLQMHDDVSTATVEAVKTELPRLTHEPLRLPPPPETAPIAAPDQDPGTR